jgi:ParB family chromosome partitioning protein
MAIMQILISSVKVRSDWNIRKTLILPDLNSLKASIAEIGLQHPITINSNNELVAGYRRYAACSALGHTTILANVMEFKTELHERLAHIDENLESKTLNEKELEKALSERKRIYETLYPISKKTGPKKETEQQKSFATETAEKTGIDESKIRKLTRRVDDVTDEVRIAYEEDKINVSQIDEIVKLDKEDQNKILKKIIGTSIAETRLIVNDFLKAKAEKLKPNAAKKKRNQAENPIIADKLDERVVDAILESQKIQRYLSGAIGAIDHTIGKKLLQYLDDSEKQKLRRSIKQAQNRFEKIFIEIGDE